MRAYPANARHWVYLTWPEPFPKRIEWLQVTEAVLPPGDP
jgi:hypothetical protein